MHNLLRDAEKGAMGPAAAVSYCTYGGNLVSPAGPRCITSEAVPCLRGALAISSLHCSQKVQRPAPHQPPSRAPRQSNPVYNHAVRVGAVGAPGRGRTRCASCSRGTRRAWPISCVKVHCESFVRLTKKARVVHEVVVMEHDKAAARKRVFSVGPSSTTD